MAFQIANQRHFHVLSTNKVPVHNLKSVFSKLLRSHFLGQNEGGTLSMVCALPEHVLRKGFFFLEKYGIIYKINGYIDLYDINMDLD